MCDIFLEGDAFLALWKITQANMDHILTRVIKCGLRIQERCDNWDTEVGVKLRVKIGKKKKLKNGMSAELGSNLWNLVIRHLLRGYLLGASKDTYRLSLYSNTR